jgi:trigger factor
MKVQVEHISNIEKKVIVELPVDSVDRALDDQYKRLGRTARVKGFRPGKVPRSLIRKMFRNDAQSAASTELIQSNLLQAMEQAEVEPLNMPDIDRGELVEGQDYSFSLQCQVRPEIDVQGLDDLKVERQMISVPDEPIDQELQALREKHAELEPVEDRAADTGDTLTVDFKGILDGESEPFEGGTGSDQSIELGAGTLVPGFEDQLIGAKEGDEVNVAITFPEDYVEALATKEATFQVSVKSVKRKVLSDLDDEFARDLEYDDLSSLRGAIYDRKYKEMCDAEDTRVRKEILDAITEANDVVVPTVMSQAAAGQLRSELHARMQMSGLGHDEIHHLMEEQGDSIETRGVDLAKRDLLLGAIAKREELEVNDEELDGRLDSIAEATGKSKSWVKATLVRENRLEGLKIEVLHDKVFEWLEERATGGTSSGTEANGTDVSETDDAE